MEHIPLLTDDGSTSPAYPPYLLIFDNGTTTERKYEDLSEAMHPSATASSPVPHNNIGIPTLFQDKSKAKMDINGVFHKGYISRQANNNYHFRVQHGPHSPTELWGVPLKIFEKSWYKMIMDETLFPSHNNGLDLS